MSKTTHADVVMDLIAQHDEVARQRDALIADIQAIDKLTCNCPCMSLQAQHEFDRSPAAEAFRVSMAGLILEIRAQARAAISKATA